MEHSSTPFPLALSSTTSLIFTTVVAYDAFKVNSTIQHVWFTNSNHPSYFDNSLLMDRLCPWGFPSRTHPAAWGIKPLTPETPRQKKLSLESLQFCSRPPALLEWLKLADLSHPAPSSPLNALGKLQWKPSVIKSHFVIFDQSPSSPSFNIYCWLLATLLEHMEGSEHRKCPKTQGLVLAVATIDYFRWHWTIFSLTWHHNPSPHLLNILCNWRSWSS